MKSKRKKKIGMAIFIITLLVISFFIGKQTGTSSEASADATTTQLTEVQVSTQTIQKTLTSSGQISSSETEKLEMSTSKYFKTLCVEEDDTVSKGDKLVKYSNGTYLTAPYNGVIKSISVPETGSIATSSHYIEIQSLENLSMVLSVNESEISEVEVGQEVEITLSADEEKTYTGKITKIDGIGTYSSSGTTFNATIEFENDGAVKIGMSASCTIILKEAENVMTLPIAAVQTKNNEKYVVVVKEDGNTEEVTVETGISNDSYVEITSGLTGDETIQMLQTVSNSSSRNYNKTNSSTNNSGTGGFGGMTSSGSMPSGSMPSR